MKKNLLRGVAALVLLPVCLLVLGGLGYAVYAWAVLGRADAPSVAYLRAHQRSVPTDTTTAFPDFDADFYANQLFLLGESHGSAAPQALDFALLRHLNQKTGLRNYVAEIDPSQAYFFNRYLATGNEADVRTVFAAWDGVAQWGNQNFYDKIRRIRALNQTLPAAARIRFIGLDRLQNLAIVGQHLRALLAQEAYVAGTAAVLDTLLRVSAAPLTEEAFGQLAHRLLPVLAAGAGTGLSAAGRAGVVQVLRNATYLQGPRIRRDSVMLLNLQAACETLQPGDEKMYGLWGFHHMLQAEVDQQQPFAALVRASNLPLRHRVVSLATYAVGSEVMIPTGVLPAAVRPAGPAVAVGWLNADGPVVLVPGVADLVAAAPAGAAATVFRLDAPGSPYRHSLRLADIRVPLLGQSQAATRAGGATVDYFQYVVLLRNSAAVAALRGGPLAAQGGVR